jgi:membrane protein YqaA with SNARE-associated domain
MDLLFALAGMFATAFLAATIFPAQSEVALIGLQLAGYPVVPLVLVASIGNTLGAVVNWALGRGIEHLRDRKWFPIGPHALERAACWYRKWGRWSLLLSWLPVGGDALTVVAGIMREPLWSFLVIVGLAKTARYATIALASAGVSP